MKLFASLDAKDRKLLLICLGTVVVLAVVTGLFARNQNRDDNPLPSSYLTGRHGARAAYEMLADNGYSIERWEQPLSDLAARADAGTVVILADPFPSDTEDFKAVDVIVKRGGRVLVTGMTGGELAPGSAARSSTQFEATCKLTPQGLDPLAGSGEVWMQPDAGWRLTSPGYRVQYNCGNEPAVVEYRQGSGQVVWWAGSTPLENGSINRADNLEFFLNALGAREGHHFFWDESLHGETRTEWFYARGPAYNLLLAGLGCIALLVIFSFSRRRGPVRELPLPRRSTPVEFLEALGSLYARAGASATAVQLAYERFKRNMSALCGLNGMQMSAAQLAEALRRRFPQAATELEKDRAASEEAVTDDRLAPKRALALVQALSRYSEFFAAAASSGRREG